MRLVFSPHLLPSRPIAKVLQGTNERPDPHMNGAGDGNRTNPNEPNKGVTTRFSVQSESNGVKSTWITLAQGKRPTGGFGY